MKDLDFSGEANSAERIVFCISDQQISPNTVPVLKKFSQMLKSTENSQLQIICHKIQDSKKNMFKMLGLMIGMQVF